MEIVEICKF